MHCPQRIQTEGSVTTGFFDRGHSRLGNNTPMGQTSMQAPHETHCSLIWIVIDALLPVCKFCKFFMPHSRSSLYPFEIDDSPEIVQFDAVIVRRKEFHYLFD
jgi:hypothetical protein